MCITPGMTPPMSLIQAITRVWFTIHGRHLITFTWVTGLTPGTVMSTVILMDLAIHRGITHMVIMVIIQSGTSRITTILIGGPTVDIVHILAIAGGTIMATAIARRTPTIAVTVIVQMMRTKNLPLARIVISAAVTARQSGATSQLRRPVMPATRVWSSGVAETPRSVKAAWNLPNRLGRNPSVPGLQPPAQCRGRRQHHQ